MRIGAESPPRATICVCALIYCENTIMYEYMESLELSTLSMSICLAITDRHPGQE